MEYMLPKIGKAAIPLSHFPTRHQAFIFRASEFVSAERMANILRTTKENVIQAANEMGVPYRAEDDVWLNKGYITIVRQLWHILPYEQLLELLEMDEATFATILREEDFLDVKLGDKPDCEPVYFRALTEEEQARTKKIKEIMSALPAAQTKSFDFQYRVPKLQFSGDEVFHTRMIYAFSGLYQNAFEVDSRTYLPDELLAAYRNIGVNAIWTQGLLSQLTEFPWAPEISNGWQARIERMRDLTDRLEAYGIKLFLYLNEPRSMPKSFYVDHAELQGHRYSEDKLCLCISTPEVREYLTSAVEKLCRSVPKLGGFFTITRSENPTNCYSHAVPESCTCPRCSKRSVADVIADTIACYRNGADRVDPNIKVIAWSWQWREFADEIIQKLPKGVILQAQSELDVPFEKGGVKGRVLDYSMSNIGPGELALGQWKLARERGLEVSAKVQVNTSWEASTCPALPVYPLIEEHIRRLKEVGVSNIMLSWTLGGYPSLSVAHAAKYFYEHCDFPQLSDNVKRASEIFSEAFCEYPFHCNMVYCGPHNAGPSSLLFEKKTGYTATMTCYAYDDIESWRSIYPLDVWESQFAKLCDKWKEGLALLEGEEQSETKIMAQVAYLLFRSSLDQMRFYRAREAGDRAQMLLCAEQELKSAEEMLSLMLIEPAIGFEAANHYYFSRGQLAEKILNCRYLIETLK
ncbi:MAG: hypothetical protein IJW50_01255 [Clostridia bacterium]|nr:hypothetical protein [Clostridia bacterium]